MNVIFYVIGITSGILLIIFGIAYRHNKFEKIALWGLKNRTLVDKKNYMRLQGNHSITQGLIIVLSLVSLVIIKPKHLSPLFLILLCVYVLGDAVIYKILLKRYIH